MAMSTLQVSPVSLQVFLPRLHTIHDFFLLVLAVISVQELNVLLYLEKNILPRFWGVGGGGAEIILGHLAQRMLKFVPRDTGENRPSDSTPTQETIFSDSMPVIWPNCAADLPLAASPWLFPNSSF